MNHRRQSSNPDSSVFTLTLPLLMEPYQRHIWDKIFRLANDTKNLLIADGKRRLEQMERTRKWRYIQRELCCLYDIKMRSPEQERKRQQLLKERQQMLNQYGMTEYAFSARMTKLRKAHKQWLPSQPMQKVSAAVWCAFESYLFRNGKEIHFSKWFEFVTLEGKSNRANIIYRNGYVSMCKVKAKVKFDRNDPYGYQTEALNRKIHYCKIIRRCYPDGWRYFLQLVLGGRPPVKEDPITGQALHPMGSGRVGIDIGSHGLAIASLTFVRLERLAAHVQGIENELRQIHRMMDRSRRAMNREMFAADGTAVPVNRLPEHCVKNNRRVWRSSNRYRKLIYQKLHLHGKQTRLRKQLHQEMANRFLSLGNDFYVERINYDALAKQTKTQLSGEGQPNGKPIYRNPFGKSIADKAPELFLMTLSEKVTQSGGSFQYIDSKSANTHQYDHIRRDYEESPVSFCWRILPDGRRVQRALYSAFLIMNTASDLKSFDPILCDRTFEPFFTLHEAEIGRNTRII